VLARQVLYNLIHIPALFVLGYFSDNILNFCSAGPGYMLCWLCTWDYRMNHHTQVLLLLLRWDPANFFAQVVLELRSSWSLPPTPSHLSICGLCALKSWHAK
jgi:hypothetical protein